MRKRWMFTAGLIIGTTAMTWLVVILFATNAVYSEIERRNEISRMIIELS